MMSTSRYLAYGLAVSAVFLLGLGVPLLEFDSAQFAVMAMRMVNQGDYLNLYKGPNEYLDKPHMHYWLAAGSYLIFGVKAWAYRLPALLALFLGAASCRGLARRFYGYEAGRIAFFIFLTAQTIVLAGMDVRTDAVLTGFAVFSIWQFVRYMDTGRWTGMVWGAIGAAVAFSTKGQIALLVIGTAVLVHLIDTRAWHRLFHPKVLLGLLVFALAISPMLWAYYQQFDLHPEKVIRGRSDRSGIYFIFWEQSFERMSGTGHGTNSSDYFFFYHTFLWIFLPWSAIALVALWERGRTWVVNRFARDPERPMLPFATVLVLFPIISLAQFKLPHYLNILVPFFAVLTAGYLHRTVKTASGSIPRVLLILQWSLWVVALIATGLIVYWVFPAGDGIRLIGYPLVVLVSILLIPRHEAVSHRLLGMGVAVFFLVNTVMNAHFYPNLLRYEAGWTLAERALEAGVPVDRVYKLDAKATWAFDFYTRRPLPVAPLEQWGEEGRGRSGDWLYVDDSGLQALGEMGVEYDIKYSANQFRITRLQPKFLDPSRREESLSAMHLLRVVR